MKANAPSKIVSLAKTPLFLVNSSLAIRNAVAISISNQSHLRLLILSNIVSIAHKIAKLALSISNSISSRAPPALQATFY